MHFSMWTKLSSRQHISYIFPSLAGAPPVTLATLSEACSCLSSSSCFNSSSFFLPRRSLALTFSDEDCNKTTQWGKSRGTQYRSESDCSYSRTDFSRCLLTVIVSRSNITYHFPQCRRNKAKRSGRYQRLNQTKTKNWNVENTSLWIWNFDLPAAEDRWIYSNMVQPTVRVR